MGPEADDLDPIIDGSQRLYQGETVGHPRVHDEDGGTTLGHPVGGLVRVSGNADDLDRGVGTQHGVEPIAVDPQIRDNERSDESHTPHHLCPNPTLNG